MVLAWSEELSVGNAMIDSDHKKMFDLVNNIVHAIRTRDHYSTLPQAFEQLEYCLCAHFESEKKIAQAVRFAFCQNDLQHKYVLKALRLTRDAVAAMSAKNGMWSDEAAEHYSSFLSDWLINHVNNEDMLMKPILQTYPYNFNPDLEVGCC